MSANQVCPKCGSAEVIPDVHLVSPGATYIVAIAYEKPDAMVFKGSGEYNEMRARVCGGCGYAELFVTNPGEMLAAYRSRRGGR